MPRKDAPQPVDPSQFQTSSPNFGANEIIDFGGTSFSDVSEFLGIAHNVIVEPVSFITDNYDTPIPVTDWDQSDWMKFMGDRYKFLAVPHNEQFIRLKRSVREKMGTFMTEFYDALKHIHQVMQEDPSSMTRRRSIPLPKVILSSNEYMINEETHRPSRFKYNSRDGSIFVNVEMLADTAAKIDDEVPFHSYTSVSKKGRKDMLYHAGTMGKLFLEGIQFAALDLFAQKEGSILGATGPYAYDSLAHHDAQPANMYSLLAQVSAASTYIDLLYNQWAEKHPAAKGRRHPEIPEIDDDSVKVLLERVDTAWHTMPREWQSKLASIKDRIFGEYQNSYENRQVKDQQPED